jgi:hypothetical protein
MFGTWTGIPDRMTFTYSKQRVPVKPVSVKDRYRFNGNEDRLKGETVGPTGTERRGDPPPVVRHVKLSDFFV